MLSLKYTPKSFAEILGNEKTCKKLLENIQNKYATFHIIHGPVGSGKTVIIKNVLKHLVGAQLHDFEFDFISTKAILEKLEKITNNVHMSHKMKVIVIEDIEIYENLNLSRIFEFINSECHNSKTIVLIACNDNFIDDFTKIFSKTKIQCELYEVLKPTENALYCFLKTISKAEKIKMPRKKDLDKITDIRYLLNNLNNSKSRNLATSDQSYNYEEILTQLTNPDISITEKFKISKNDVTPLPIYIFESYLKYTDESINTYLKIMNSVTFGDFLYTKMFTNQLWQLIDETILFSTIIPSSLFQNNCQISLNKPSVWSRYSNMCLKRKNLKMLMYNMDIFNYEILLAKRQELITSISEQSIKHYNEYDESLIKCFSEDDIFVKKIIKEYKNCKGKQKYSFIGN